VEGRAKENTIKDLCSLPGPTQKGVSSSRGDGGARQQTRGITAKVHIDEQALSWGEQ